MRPMEMRPWASLILYTTSAEEGIIGKDGTADEKETTPFEPLDPLDCVKSIKSSGESIFGPCSTGIKNNGAIPSYRTPLEEIDCGKDSAAEREASCVAPDYSTATIRGGFQPPFRLYAEILHNIRSATIVAVLPKPTSTDTAKIFRQGRTTVFAIDGGEVAILLPSSMDEPAPVELEVPDLPTTEIAVRLVMLPPGQTNDSKPPREGDLLNEPELERENVAPWTAERMMALRRPASRAPKRFACCRWCQIPLLYLDAMREWRNLPREGWDEMLDFWHCHRPHEKDGQGSGHGNDEHSDEHDCKHPASNRIQIAPGRGFVGLLYLLLAPEDCTAVEVRFPPPLFIPANSRGWQRRRLSPEHGSRPVVKPSIQPPDIKDHFRSFERRYLSPPVPRLPWSWVAGASSGQIPASCRSGRYPLSYGRAEFDNGTF